MIKISIDLNKVDKSRIKQHTNGAKYYSLVIDELKEVDKLQNTHCVYESQTKEEREAKVKRNYIGNGKEYKFNNNAASAPQNAPQQQQNYGANNGQEIDPLPF